jgi:hypothetical protein
MKILVMVSNKLVSTSCRHLPEGAEENHGNLKIDGVPTKIVNHNLYRFSHTAPFLACYSVGYSVNQLFEAFN